MSTVTTTLISNETEPTSLEAESPSDQDRVDDLPRPIQRSTTIHNPSPGFSHRHRHSKKLSLNFPILVPVQHDTGVPKSGSLSSLSQSPSVASPYRTNGTPISGHPLPSPDELPEPADGPDFLTLIAGQERRVMELKEELQKAETELLGLKKQWTMFEANKKHAEIRNKTVKLGPVSPKSARTNAEDDAERVRRREAAREKKLRDLALRELGSDSSNSNGVKRKVFAGRHTRTLSLLQNNVLDSEQNSQLHKLKRDPEELPSPAADAGPDEENNRRTQRPSISRQPTLQELISGSATGAAQMNFGKTYKELAQASRKSLPPGTDVFVKQGKQVYDGINQGFWNFVEDIRQATVGDEPVNGVPADPRRELRRPKSAKRLNGEESCEKHTRPNRKGSKKSDLHKGDKDNFWKEFGLETPKNQRQSHDSTIKTATTKEEKHESKSSTDSQCPPSLLADLLDVNEDDEAWDNWPVESPSAQRHTARKVKIRDPSEDGDIEEDEHAVSPSLRGGKEILQKFQRPAEASWAELTS